MEEEMNNPIPKQPQPPQTLGQRRVRASFNPSGNSVVDEIKAKSAELIDLCSKIANDYDSVAGRPDVGEIRRLTSLAQTHYEDAAMWAVKAATA